MFTCVQGLTFAELLPCGQLLTLAFWRTAILPHGPLLQLPILRPLAKPLFSSFHYFTRFTLCRTPQTSSTPYDYFRLSTPQIPHLRPIFPPGPHSLLLFHSPSHSWPHLLSCPFHRSLRSTPQLPGPFSFSIAFPPSPTAKPIQEPRLRKNPLSIRQNTQPVHAKLPPWLTLPALNNLQYPAIIPQLRAKLPPYPVRIVAMAWEKNKPRIRFGVCCGKNLIQFKVFKTGLAVWMNVFSTP